MLKKIPHIFANFGGDSFFNNHLTRIKMNKILDKGANIVRQGDSIDEDSGFYILLSGENESFRPFVFYVLSFFILCLLSLPPCKSVGLQ